jgi:hypothetical protein
VCSVFYRGVRFCHLGYDLEIRGGAGDHERDDGEARRGFARGRRLSATGRDSVLLSEPKPQQSRTQVVRLLWEIWAALIAARNTLRASCRIVGKSGYLIFAQKPYSKFVQ